MLVIPIWLLKYLFAIGGFALFFQDGEFGGLVIGLIGLVWCIYNWSEHKK